MIESGYDLARSFKFCHRNVIECQRVGDHIAFVICERAFLRTFFSKEDDFIIVIILRFINGMDEELDCFFADEGDWPHKDANKIHRVDAGTKDFGTVEEADIFG